MLKANSNKKIFFNHNYLYTAYADHTTLLYMIKNFENKAIAGIRTLNSVRMEICGIKCTDVTIEIIKILVAYFFYNQKL